MNNTVNKNRRRILKSTLLGMSGVALNNVSSHLYAAQANYSGPLWLIINAEGGWDVTSLCDPKGYNGPLDATNPERINNYDRARIMRAGNIEYAPSPDIFRPGGLLYDPGLYSAEQFFNKYFSQLLVINSIDCKTNSHADGQLFNLAGKLREGFPCFSALVASALATDSTMAFMTYGGYSDTSELITPLRMNNSALNAMFEIAYPNRSFNPKSADSRLYLPDSIQRLIESASADSHQAMLNQQFLPRLRQAIQKLMNSRATDLSLQGFVDNLIAMPARNLASFNARTKAHALYLQGRMALAAFQQGLTVSVNTVINGFDTHAKHDEAHYPLLMDLLMGVDAILEEASNRGLRDRVVVAIVSDFGRTPHYNSQGGKDHWPVSSAMFIGNAIQRISGNRVIGKTTGLHEALAVDPVTLSPDFNGLNPSAELLTPAHIHSVLRQLAGIDQHPIALNFPLEVNNLRLFS